MAGGSSGGDPSGDGAVGGGAAGGGRRAGPAAEADPESEGGAGGTCWSWKRGVLTGMWRRAGRTRGSGAAISLKHPATGRMAEKLSTPAGRATYAERKWSSEAPYGWIKHVLGFRCFSLRGLAKALGVGCAWR